MFYKKLLEQHVVPLYYHFAGTFHFLMFRTRLTKSAYPGSAQPVVASRSPAARLTGLVAALRDTWLVEVAPPKKAVPLRSSRLKFFLQCKKY